MAVKKAMPKKKLFTPAQANAALPLVQAIVRDIAELAHDLRERHERTQGLQSWHPQVAKTEEQML